jgi:hypothetical protein
MDLIVIRIDLKMQDSKAVVAVRKAIDRIGSRYKHTPLLLTVDYQSYKHLLRLGLRTRLFTEELAPEVEEGIIEEAQRRAEKIIGKFWDEAILFKGINPLDLLHYEISTHIAGILRVKHVCHSNASKPGAILLFTSSNLLRSGPDSELPVLDQFEIGRTRRWGYIRAALRFALRRWKAVADRSSDISPNTGTQAKQLNHERGRKNVLLVTVDNRICMEPLTPVLKKLRESPDMKPFVAVDSLSTQEYLKEGLIESIVYSQYYDVSHSTLQWAKSFRRLTRTALELVHENKVGTIDALIASSFCRQFVNFGTLVGVYSRILWVNHVFQVSRPSIVVAYPLHSHVVRASISIARTRQVPVMVFVYSWVYGQKPGGDLLAFRTYDNSDFIIATGEDCVQALVMDGVDPKKIILVGNPKFDVIASHGTAQDREHVRRLLGANPGDLLFSVTSYMLAPGTAQWVRALVRQLKSFPSGFKLIIRPHPDESPVEYERILKEEEFANATISTDVPLYSLLNASDIVFTGMSTVGSEAVLFDKPLICLNLSENPYSVRYDEDGVALLVKSEKDILPTIETVLHNEKVRHELGEARKRFRESLAYKLDGHAAKRFVEAIRSLLDSAGDHASTDLENQAF